MSIDARRLATSRAPGRLRGSTLASPSRRVADDDEGAYQVDLIVTLFAVLMLLLTVSSLSLGSEAKLVGYTRYSPTDEPLSAFQLQTFSPVYPYRTYWVAMDGELVEISLEAVARRYAAAGNETWGETIDDAFVSVTPRQGEADGYILRLRLLSRSVPAWLSGRRFALADTDVIVAALLNSPGSSHIFVWPDQHEPLAPAVAKVRAVGKPLSLGQPDGKSFYIERSAVEFQLNRILRGQ